MGKKRKGSAALAWTWDRKAKRWRHGGRFSAPPPADALRMDKRGNALDSRGKRIPKEALARLRSRADQAQEALARLRALPPSIPSPPKRKRPPPIVHTSGNSAVFGDGAFNSSANNRRPPGPDTVAEIFAAILESRANKGPFEAADIIVTNHAVSFYAYHASKHPDRQLLDKLRELTPPGGSIRVVNMGNGTSKVRMYFGSSDKPKLADEVYKSFEKNTERVQRMYDELMDFWGEVQYWVIFETEESLYG